MIFLRKEQVVRRLLPRDPQEPRLMRLSVNTKPRAINKGERDSELMHNLSEAVQKSKMLILSLEKKMR